MTDNNTDIFITETDTALQDTDSPSQDPQSQESHWYTDCTVTTDLLSGEEYADIPHIDQQRDWIKIYFIRPDMWHRPYVACFPSLPQLVGQIRGTTQMANWVPKNLQKGLSSEGIGGTPGYLRMVKIPGSYDQFILTPDVEHLPDDMLPVNALHNEYAAIYIGDMRIGNTGGHIIVSGAHGQLKHPIYEVVPKVDWDTNGRHILTEMLINMQRTHSALHNTDMITTIVKSAPPHIQEKIDAIYRDIQISYLTLVRDVCLNMPHPRMLYIILGQLNAGAWFIPEDVMTDIYNDPHGVYSRDYDALMIDLQIAEVRTLPIAKDSDVWKSIVHYNTVIFSRVSEFFNTKDAAKKLIDTLCILLPTRSYLRAYLPNVMSINNQIIRQMVYQITRQLDLREIHEWCVQPQFVNSFYIQNSQVGNTSVNEIPAFVSHILDCVGNNEHYMHKLTVLIAYIGSHPLRIYDILHATQLIIINNIEDLLEPFFSFIYDTIVRSGELDRLNDYIERMYITAINNASVCIDFFKKVYPQGIDQWNKWVRYLQPDFSDFTLSSVRSSRLFNMMVTQYSDTFPDGILNYLKGIKRKNQSMTIFDSDVTHVRLYVTDADVEEFIQEFDPTTALTYYLDKEYILKLDKETEISLNEYIMSKHTAKIIDKISNKDYATDADHMTILTHFLGGIPNITKYIPNIHSYISDEKYALNMRHLLYITLQNDWIYNDNLNDIYALYHKAGRIPPINLANQELDIFVDNEACQYLLIANFNAADNESSTHNLTDFPFKAPPICDHIQETCYSHHVYKYIKYAPRHLVDKFVAQIADTTPAMEILAMRIRYQHPEYTDAEFQAETERIFHANWPLRGFEEWADYDDIIEQDTALTDKLRALLPELGAKYAHQGNKYLADQLLQFTSKNVYNAWYNKYAREYSEYINQGGQLSPNEWSKQQIETDEKRARPYREKIEVYKKPSHVIAEYAPEIFSVDDVVNIPEMQPYLQGMDGQRLLNTISILFEKGLAHPVPIIIDHMGKLLDGIMRGLKGSLETLVRELREGAMIDASYARQLAKMEQYGLMSNITQAITRYNLESSREFALASEDIINDALYTLYDKDLTNRAKIESLIGQYTAIVLAWLLNPPIPQNIFTPKQCAEQLHTCIYIYFQLGGDDAAEFILRLIQLMEENKSLIAEFMKTDAGNSFGFIIGSTLPKKKQLIDALFALNITISKSAMEDIAVKGADLHEFYNIVWKSAKKPYKLFTNRSAFNYAWSTMLMYEPADIHAQVAQQILNILLDERSRRYLLHDMGWFWNPSNDIKPPTIPCPIPDLNIPAKNTENNDHLIDVIMNVQDDKLQIRVQEFINGREIDRPIFDITHEQALEFIIWYMQVGNLPYNNAQHIYADIRDYVSWLEGDDIDESRFAPLNYRAV